MSDQDERRGRTIERERKRERRIRKRYFPSLLSQLFMNPMQYANRAFRLIHVYVPISLYEHVTNSAQPILNAC